MFNWMGKKIITIFHAHKISLSGPVTYIGHDYYLSKKVMITICQSTRLCVSAHKELDSLKMRKQYLLCLVAISSTPFRFFIRRSRTTIVIKSTIIKIASPPPTINGIFDGVVCSVGNGETVLEEFSDCVVAHIVELLREIGVVVRNVDEWLDVDVLGEAGLTVDVAANGLTVGFGDVFILWAGLSVAVVTQCFKAESCDTIAFKSGFGMIRETPDFCAMSEESGDKLEVSFEFVSNLLSITTSENLERVSVNSDLFKCTGIPPTSVLLIVLARSTSEITSLLTALPLVFELTALTTAFTSASPTSLSNFRKESSSGEKNDLGLRFLTVSLDFTFCGTMKLDLLALDVSPNFLGSLLSSLEPEFTSSFGFLLIMGGNTVDGVTVLQMTKNTCLEIYKSINDEIMQIPECAC